MKNKSHRITPFEKTEYSVPDLIKFHGHLGPYIVLGYRMGRFARKQFDNYPDMDAVVHCPDNPPTSCLVDGIQLGSGCSYGRRKISLVHSSDIFCNFISEDKTLVLRPVTITLPAADSPTYWEETEEIALALYDAPDESLFHIV
ncbi:MAG: formylmethanofuran dehydrogenase subunit E family protein [Methanoregula sp.]|jgi:formylmethanofuran dehydrogenase subunit E|uniref:formylmethanofuran dehydrogenase subunit E family protein n=1 Tax=Methanoregula sp. TaxID=2052170 RepID=UPI0025F01CF8|nr:formylmethanofuran dehydrogenase subunit E family protein [Methanoregula sp.]MCK9632381.1 formylmethanofuran dehydrogenase subunit E family protein [Methanoregula sp.]